MLKLVRIFIAGIFISFIGALPLGTINISAMQLAITDGVQPAVLFALGMIPPDIFYVLVTLLAMQWIQRQKRLFKALEWVTLAIVVALAAANFYAALHPAVQKNILLSSTLPPFFLGMVMNAVNPLQVPFWFGWNTILLNKKTLEHRWLHYNTYAAGVSVGLFAGTAIFIFGGKLVADKINRNQNILSWAIGGIFFLTALYQIWKMQKKKDVVHQLEHPEEIAATFEKKIEKIPK